MALWCFNLFGLQTAQHEPGVSDVLSDLFSTSKHKLILVICLTVTLFDKRFDNCDPLCLTVNVVYVSVSTAGD